MASASNGDVLCELAQLVGMETICIRKTDESPPRVSVIDVAVAVTGHDANYASEAVRNIRKKCPDIHERIGDHAFLDARGRKCGKNTPVIDVSGIVEIIMLLPGEQAAQVRRQAAELLVRYLTSDLAIISEINAIRIYQKHLADKEPNNPRRLFGESVEATLDPAPPKAACTETLVIFFAQIIA